MDRRVFARYGNVKSDRRIGLGKQSRGCDVTRRHSAGRAYQHAPLLFAASLEALQSREESHRLEFELGAWFEAACGLASVLALS